MMEAVEADTGEFSDYSARLGEGLASRLITSLPIRSAGPSMRPRRRRAYRRRPRRGVAARQH